MPDHKSIEERLKKAKDALYSIQCAYYGGSLIELVSASLTDLESLLAELTQYKAPLPADQQKVVEEALKEQIEYMVQRFLGWKLPENFNPDGGISFKKYFNEHTDHPMKSEPTGTNLLDYTQAKEMFRYLMEGMSTALLDRTLRENAELKRENERLRSQAGLPEIKHFLERP